jgi:hypothetical protein
VLTAAFIVVASLGLATLLLAIPVEVAFAIERQESTRGTVRVGWMFGLVRFRIDVPRPATPRGVGAEEGGGRRRCSGRPGRALAMLRRDAFRRRAWRSLRDLLRVLQPRDLSLWVRLGLGDPADMGRLWGLAWPVAALARAIDGADVRLEPEFVEEILHFHARGRVVTSPLRLLAIAGGLALSPTTAGAWWASRGRRA